MRANLKGAGTARGIEAFKFTIRGSGPSPFPFLRFFLAPFPWALAFCGAVVCIKRDAVAAAAAVCVDAMRREQRKSPEKEVVVGSLVKRPRNVGVNIVSKR